MLTKTKTLKTLLRLMTELMCACSHSTWNFEPTEVNVETSCEFTDTRIWSCGTIFLFIVGPICTSCVSEKGPQVLLSWHKLA